MSMSETTQRKGIDWDKIGPYDARKNKAALGMFSVLLLTYVLNAMDRQVFTVVATDVRRQIDASIPQIGLASTIFTLGMGVAGLPTGYLMARLQRKYVAIVGIALFSVATFMTAHIQGMTDLLVYRFISGLGEAMQLTAILAIGTTYFFNHRAIAASSLNFCFGIGAIIGPNLGAALTAGSSWRLPFLAFGIAGIPAIILVFFLVKSWFSEYRPENVKDPGATTFDPTTDTGATSIFQRGPLLMSLATVFGALAIYGYLGLYATYLREVVGFTPKQAGFAVSCYGLGALLSLFGGWLGDKYDFRMVLMIAFVVSAISGTLLFTGISSFALQCVLSFVFGGSISGMGYANLSGGIIKSLRRDKGALASGLFTTSLYVPAAFAGSLIGWTAQQVGWTTAGMLQLGVCSIVAGLLALASGRAKRPVTAAR